MPKLVQILVMLSQGKPCSDNVNQTGLLNKNDVTWEQHGLMGLSGNRELANLASGERL